MSPTLLVSAMLLGLLGSGHCVAMCGGVVAMSCTAIPLGKRARVAAQLPMIAGYNAGRILSYAAAGAAAGALGTSLQSLGVVEQVGLALRLAAALAMLCVGAYLAGFTRALRWAERAGAPVWQRIAPLARRLVPVRSPAAALALGMLWGWMPCGLVYAALAIAVTSGSWIGGAATMAAFGAGTLPMLLAMGSASGLATRFAQSRRVRVAARVIVVAFGVLQLGHVGRAWAQGDARGPHACCDHHTVVERLGGGSPTPAEAR
jgi:sulfite exporter TauE/SafE